MLSLTHPSNSQVEMGIKNQIQTPKSLDLIREYGALDGVYLCGGWVRDYFIGKKPDKDIDVFIDCSPNQLQDLIKHLSRHGKVEYGQYGSPRFYSNEKDNHEYIDIVPFYNFMVSETPVSDIYSLLHNFDISANAIAIDLKKRILINPENGVQDIKDKILRAIRMDFPEKRVPNSKDLSTNTVFWFRLLHYQSCLGFSVESSTLKWIEENSWRIKDIDKFTNSFFQPMISEEMKNVLHL